MLVDLIITNAYVYNTYFKKFFKEDIAIHKDKIVYVGVEEIYKYHSTTTIDANNKYLVPGLIDIHMHIESSMATPMAFSHEIIKNGVTTIVSEPHEVANVFGINGINEMIKSGDECIADIYYGIPSSVPSTNSDFETTGYEINLKEIKELINNKEVICLGEVMNYYDVINKPSSKTNNIIDYIKKNYPHMPIEGHCPKIMGSDLATYIYRGVNSDHTQQTLHTMEERIKRGMFIQIQDKSLKKDIVDYLVNNNLYENFCFVTDDVMADTLSNQGHLNTIVKKAISLGMPVEYALYCATHTPAMRMGLKDRGSLSPGKLADFIILDDIEQLNIDFVYKKGKLVYDSNKIYTYKSNKYRYPKYFYNSIVRDKVTENDFIIKAPIDNGEIMCRTIVVSKDTTFTKEEVHRIDVINNILQWEKSDFCLISVLERHGKNSNISFGLITGDTIKRGAVATSYAHDHHNILAIGKNIEDLVIAINEVITHQGGIYVVENTNIKGKISLPIAGILSEKSITEIGADLQIVREALHNQGYNHYNSIMSLCTNSLPVSQLLKITDKGLIKLNENKIVDLYLEV